MDAQPPLDWHPWYRDKTWLLDWLEGSDQKPIQLAVPRSMSAVWTDEIAPTTADMPSTLVLTKRRAWGAAPYVGTPFHYEWPVAVDNLGRQITGEVRIVHHRDAWMYA